MNQTMSGVIDNLMQSYGGLISLLFLCFRLLGVIFIVWGVNNFRELASDRGRQSSSHPVTQSLVSILVGAVLLALPKMIGDISATVFLGTGGNNLMDYAEPTGIANSFFSIRLLLNLIGVYMFGKGWMTLRQIGVNGSDRDHSFKSAAVRIIAGTLLVHIVDFLKVMSVSLGLPIIDSWIRNFGG